jgi:4-amino-4-deoxy-L-arabinose transferase-like glycosyltransferase
MIESGNYLQPMFHGQPYFLKPPLINWFIAASAELSGAMTEFSSRMPSVIMALLAALSLYFMTGRWLNIEGRLFAALAALTTTGLILRGRAAEVDSLFIFLVLLVLLVWINAYSGKWNQYLLWGLPLFLLGISLLTKGPQAPAYFYSTVIAFLFIRKRLPMLFTAGHMFGLLIFAGLILLFLSVVLRTISLGEYIDIWVGQVAQRGNAGKSSFFGHLFKYPASAFLNFMPWILFCIPALIFRDLRRAAKRLLDNELVLFSVVMIAVNFPVYWLLPSSRDRYILPVAPFLIIVAAALFELYIQNAEKMPAVRTFLKRLLIAFAMIALVAVVLLAAAALQKGLQLPLPALIIAAAVITLSFYVILRTDKIQLRSLPVVTAFLVGLLFPLFFGIYAQYLSVQESYPKKIAAEINSVLPDDAEAIYELGYKRFQAVSCYLKKKVLMADGFDKLQAMQASGRDIYFIYDTGFLDDPDDNPRKTSLTDGSWDRIYSKYLRKGKGELVVGRLRGRP